MVDITRAQRNESSRDQIDSGIKKLMKPSKGPNDVKIIDHQTSEQRIEEQKQSFLKLITASFQYQSPDDPASTEELTQTFAALQQTEEAIQTNSILRKIENSLGNSEINKALPLQGKKVNYDTSHKDFNGKDAIEFNYQLQFDEHKRPSGAHISNIITILNEKGQVIRRTQGEVEKGRHKFKWDGKDNLGKSVPPGKYSIKVEAAWEQLVEGTNIRTPIEAGGFDSGIVDSVEIVGGKVKLNINGTYIDQEDIIKVIGQEEVKPEYNLSNYANYLGKTAIIHDNIVAVKNSKATMNFNCDIAFPARAQLKLFTEEGQLVSVALASNITPGRNQASFEFFDTRTVKEAEEALLDKAKYKKIEAGDYRYELYIEDLAETGLNKFKLVDFEKQITITGLDFTDKPYITSGEDRYLVNQIKQLETTNAEASNLFTEGASFLRKKAIITRNELVFDGGAPITTEYQVPMLDAGNSYKNSFMRIYDQSDALVRELKLEAGAILTGDSELYPLDENLYDFLTDQGKKSVLIKANILTEDQINRDGLFYSSLTALERAVYQDEDYQNDYLVPIREYISHNLEDVKNYIDPVKIKPDYNALSAEGKSAIDYAIKEGFTVNSFSWNGSSNTGRTMPKGKYRYEILVEKAIYGADGRIVSNELIPIKNKTEVYIASYELEKGALNFTGHPILEDESGDKIADHNHPIFFSKEEILSLS